MKLLVFLHGTIIMHSSGVDKTHKERVEQSRKRDSSVLDYENYVPIGNAVEKLKQWQSQGHEISYLSSHESAEDAANDQSILDKYDFPKAPIHWRDNKQTYAQVAEKIMPDVLIEDDCESIGGEIETTYYHINPATKPKIRQILVKEFGGIDDVEL